MNTMNFTALESLETVWLRKGWQMATYRSTVNAVIVSTVALAQASAMKPVIMQKASLNSYVLKHGDKV